MLHVIQNIIDEGMRAWCDLNTTAEK